MDRVHGEFTLGKIQAGFEFPEDVIPSKDFDAHSNTRHAVVDVRHGKGWALRGLATHERNLGEWDQLTIPILNIDTLTSLILWHGEDALVVEPRELRDLVITHLQALVANHG